MVIRPKTSSTLEKEAEINLPKSHQISFFIYMDRISFKTREKFLFFENTFETYELEIEILDMYRPTWVNKIEIF